MVVNFMMMGNLLRSFPEVFYVRFGETRQQNLARRDSDFSMTLSVGTMLTVKRKSAALAAERPFKV